MAVINRTMEQMDIESQNPRPEGCCGQGLYSDWSQYILTFGAIYGLAVAAYAFSPTPKFYAVGAGTAVLVAFVIFGIIRIGCLRPLFDLQQNTDRLATQDRRLDQQLQKEQGNLTTLEGAVQDFKTEETKKLETTAQQNADRSAQLEKIDDLTNQINKSEARFTALSSLYTEMKKSLAEGTLQIKSITDLYSKETKAVKDLGKEKERVAQERQAMVQAAFVLGEAYKEQTSLLQFFNTNLSNLQKLFNEIASFNKGNERLIKDAEDLKGQVAELVALNATLMQKLNPLKVKSDPKPRLPPPEEVVKLKQFTRPPVKPTAQVTKK